MGSHKVLLPLASQAGHGASSGWQRRVQPRSPHRDRDCRDRDTLGGPAVPPTEGLGSGRRFGHLFKSPLWGEVILDNSPGMMTKGISEAFEVFSRILLGERIFLNCERWGLVLRFSSGWWFRPGSVPSIPAPAPAAGRLAPSRTLSGHGTGWTRAPGQGDC